MKRMDEVHRDARRWRLPGEPYREAFAFAMRLAHCEDRAEREIEAVRDGALNLARHNTVARLRLGGLAAALAGDVA